MTEFLSKNYSKLIASQLSRLNHVFSVSVAHSKSTILQNNSVNCKNTFCFHTSYYHIIHLKGKCSVKQATMYSYKDVCYSRGYPHWLSSRLVIISIKITATSSCIEESRLSGIKVKVNF